MARCCGEEQTVELDAHEKLSNLLSPTSGALKWMTATLRLVTASVTHPHLEGMMGETSGPRLALSTCYVVVGGG